MAATAKTPETSSETVDLCCLLVRASHALTSELSAALGDLDVSPRAYSVLTTAMTGEHAQIEIARMVGLDKTTMVVTLDELEAAGLVERRPSATDRRARVIAVTPAGRRKVRSAERIGDRVRADVLAALPPGDREVFVASLRRLVEGPLAEPATCAQPVRRRGSGR